MIVPCNHFVSAPKHQNIVLVTYTYVRIYIYIYVSGFEKRGNFAQNAKFWHFSSYHHFKAVRASDFILGLEAHQAFCFEMVIA